MRFLFFLSIQCFIVCICPAQEYSYAHYDTREGLAGSVVYCMAQDKDGFMWFGTETGLSRFDGTQFKNFTTADGLPDNEIIKLYVDSKNRVWIIPFKNAICYYWRGKIYTAENDSLLSKLSITTEIFSITENSEGELAILETAKIHLVKTDGRVVVINSHHNDPISGILAGGLKNSKTFQFGIVVVRQGFFIYELNRDSLIKKQDVSDFIFVNHNCLYLSPELNIIRETDSLVFQFSDAQKKYKVLLPKGFLNINRLNDSLIAITSATNVYTYNIKQQKQDRVFLNGKRISSVIEDREGNLWFSSMGEGIFKLTSSEFKSYFLKQGDNSLPVISIKKYGDTLYIGTDHFLLWSLDLKTQKFTHNQVNNGISQGRLISIDKTRSGDLVIGTDDGVYLKSDKGFSPLKVLNAIKSTYLYNDTIIIGTNVGIYLLLENNLSKVDSIWQGRASAVFYQGNNIYIGTLNGLLVLPVDGKPQYMGNTHPSLKRRVSAIGNSPDGTIWITTYGNGIAGYKNGRVVSVITEDDGLTSNICRSLFITDSTLWVGTDRGLNKVRFSGSTFRISTYTVADGLVSDIINTIAVNKNQVFVGTPSGITFFNEDLVMANSMCVLRITGIRSSNHQWNYDTTNLQFGHYENNIRFEFSGISFKSAGDITYSYRLLGLDDTWQQTQDNFLHYPALPSGSYELQLLATNKFGVKSEMASISFFIDKLLWEKTWFQGLVVLLLGVLIWILVTSRIKRIRRAEAVKAETNRKITELEQMALKSQMNPHFIFNSLNAIQQYVIDKDIRGANKFITDFSRLIRLTLDISSRLKISLQEEINYISTYLELEKTRFEGKFNYAVKVLGNIDVSNTYIPTMILQPYVENSIRHGVRYLDNNDGLINIEFCEKDGFLICVIEDNGVGRAASRQYKGKMTIEYQSKGMKLTAERIEMMNKNSSVPIYVDIEDLAGDNKRAGTKVILQFPLQEVKTPN